MTAKPQDTGDLVLGYRLTAAQRAFLMALPPDGEWKPTHETLRRIGAEFGPNALRGFGQTGLIDGYYREETRHRLTELGRSVVGKLRATQSESTEA
jgi:hypothetical protein